MEMEIWQAIMVVGSSLLSGTAGAKLVDLKRERQAADRTAEETARRYLAERLAALEAQLTDARARLDRAEDALGAARMELVRSELRIQLLERERDDLRSGYERLKEELAHERALRLELEHKTKDASEKSGASTISEEA